jgi:hypothetical protein
MPHGRISYARKQIHEPFLIRALDGEDVDEGDQLGVL